ncbi:hypothetical protein B566_EDAN002184 [Ephemera danica]|nr:hypothetical protein B566_EDAN002184 [Ephemera danica]
MNGCQLTTIAPKAFDTVELLESLKLNDNRLSELRPKTVETLRRLHGVELHDNPWQCDCRLRSVKSWLQENNIPYTVDPVCGGPERVAGQSFGSLHLDDFACKPEVLPVSRYVEATTGDNASIVCRIGAIPPATISWYWNSRLLTNNSLFSMGSQRVVIYEDGFFEKSSSLVLTNAQDTDSSEFLCIAENRAGTAEANFTLHVAMRTAGMASLGSGQIAGLSAALVILILFILLLILVLLIRLRRIPFSSATKTPTPHDHQPTKVITAPTHPTIEAERRNGTVTGEALGVKPPVINIPHDAKLPCNPVQKPPRLTDISYSTSHYDGNGSVIDTSIYASTKRNPDLINEAERVKSDEPTARIIINKTGELDEHCSSDGIPRSGSGEYSRAHGDSLYPSGLWESPHSSPGQINSAVADLFLRRTTSDSFDPNMDTSDKTPIIEGAGEEYSCRTLPVRASSGHPSPWSAADQGDYPPDYGLPIPSEPPPPAPVAPGVHGTSSPPGAKTLRVWQRGAVPVLPPVTALKRVLGSRNSPDEGYQEGCGTDV